MDFKVHEKFIILVTFLYVKVISICVVIQLTSISALYHLNVNTMITYYHNAITINEMYYVIVHDCHFKALLHIVIGISLN